MRALNSRRRPSGRQIALIIVAVLAVLLPWVVTNSYLLHLIIMGLIFGVLGMCFSVQFAAGRMNLGVGTFYVIGAYMSAVLVLKAGLPVWASLFVTPIAAGIVSLGLGAVILRGTSFSFGIITMLIAMALPQVIGQFGFLGGWSGFTNVPAPEPIPVPFHHAIKFASKMPYYYLLLVMVVVVLIVLYSVYSSLVGRTWESMKLSPRLAETVGVNLYRYRLLAFVISGAIAAWMGSFYVHYYQVLEPTSFTGFFSISLQFYAVLGGLNYYLVGPLVGAFIMVFVPEALQVTAIYKDVITGVLLIMLILFLPNGVVGLARNVFQRLLGREANAEPAPVELWRWAVSKFGRRG